MDSLIQDLRYALRVFRTSPGVVFLTILVASFGIGATTTMFSVANGVLLRIPPGVRQADRLVTVEALAEDGTSFHSFSYPEFRDLREARTGLEELAAFSSLAASVTTGDEPVLQMGNLVSANYFTTIGVRPMLGRFFAPDEDRGPGGPRVVVLSHSTWQRRFGADSSLVGRAITLNGLPFTVVGITEPDFRGHVAAADIALWVPLSLDPVLATGNRLDHRGSNFLNLIGRLEEGARPEQARAALSAVSIAGGRDFGLDWDRGVDLHRYSPVPPVVLLPVGGFLGLLVVLASLVLLIATANVAHVLLARAAARSREIGVRLALGASRRRLVRQLVTESLVLFLAGGLGGLLVAIWATSALSAMRPPIPLPFQFDFSPDLRVLLVALGVTLVVGTACGLMPALQGTRLDLARIVKEDPGTARLGRWRLRNVFVTAQVAGSTLLLVTAGLFTRALARAGNVDTGFEPERAHVLSFQLQSMGYAPERVATFVRDLEERARQLPGVEAVGAADLLPLSFGNQTSVVALPDRERTEGVGVFTTDFTIVTPGFVEATGLRLVRGRGIMSEDRQGAPRVALVNETLAERIWPGQDPVGRTFRFGAIDSGPASEVVGVVRDAKYRSLGQGPIPMVYVPFAQQGARTMSLVVRTAPGASPGADLRALVRGLDPHLPIELNAPYQDLLALMLLPNRVAQGLASLFGVVGLVLAAVGLFGVISFLVERRRREIGIRMALGADNGAVRGLVLRDGVRLTVTGLVLGCLAAAGLGQLLRGLLYGLNPFDPVTYGVIVVLLGVTALLACLVPVRRALRTEPLVVLRYE